jgi:hypothetical protein
MVSPCRHVVRKQGPPSGPQSACELQLKSMTPGLSNGKNCSPIDRSLPCSSAMKLRSARWTACHLVRPLPATSSIEPEVSSITFSATLRCSAAAVCVTQAPSSSGSVPVSGPPLDAGGSVRSTKSFALSVTSTFTGSLLQAHTPAPTRLATVATMRCWRIRGRVVTWALKHKRFAATSGCAGPCRTEHQTCTTGAPRRSRIRTKAAFVPCSRRQVATVRAILDQKQAPRPSMPQSPYFSNAGAHSSTESGRSRIIRRCHRCRLPGPDRSEPE